MQEIFEKIRERLKELGWVFGEYYPDGTEVNKRTRKSVAYDDVVEIVNQVAEEYANMSESLTSSDVPDINVGENEEFCEWIRDNDEFDVYDTKCRNRHVFFEGSPEDNEYVYCPYCGKEIKVVE